MLKAASFLTLSFRGKCEERAHECADRARDPGSVPRPSSTFERYSAFVEFVRLQTAEAIVELGEFACTCALHLRILAARGLESSRDERATSQQQREERGEQGLVA